MTLIAVPIRVNGAAAVGAAIERAREAVKTGARIVEWRIDDLAHEAEAIPAAKRLVRESPAPCIVTCRPVWEGGTFEGPEYDRIELYESLLAGGEHGPRYVDVELAAIEREPAWRERIFRAFFNTGRDGESQSGLILSLHDFTGRPEKLLQRIETMVREPACSVVKVVWWARSLRDNLEAFDLLKNRRRPMIALCMGEFGLMSRVLAPKFGSLLTYASDLPGAETAPGQPTIRELRDFYHVDRIGAATRVYGVVGWPVEHSLSPAIHNAGFHAIGHDGVYLPLPIPASGGGWEHFKATVGSLIDESGLNFRGASVTIPHKENLLRFVNERGGRVDEMCERIGAANTLIVGSAGGMECVNTDCPAAMEALREAMGALAGKRCAVLGAGGVARAIVVGLTGEGAKAVICNRSRERAEALVREIGGGDLVVMGEPAAAEFDAIINCTSIGMAGGPAPDQSPLTALGLNVAMNERMVVFDTVYAPPRTSLITDAEARGARTITGLDMFLHQAAMQFERWTGVPAPMATFQRVVREEFVRRDRQAQGVP
jgi:3-dehydroquinate dehydratase / shikimate dehydrogenase